MSVQEASKGEAAYKRRPTRRCRRAFAQRSGCRGASLSHRAGEFAKRMMRADMWLCPRCNEISQAGVHLALVSVRAGSGATIANFRTAVACVRVGTVANFARTGQQSQAKLEKTGTIFRRPLRKSVWRAITKNMIFGDFSRGGFTSRPPGIARAPPEVTESIFHDFLRSLGRLLRAFGITLGSLCFPSASLWRTGERPRTNKKQSRNPIGYSS